MSDEQDLQDYEDYQNYLEYQKQSIGSTGAPDLGSQLAGSAGSGNMLRPGGDVASDLGTAALQIVGSMALPEALPFKAAPAGAGILKTLLSYLRGSAVGAAGDYAGTQVAQEVGLAPETSATSDLVRFGLNTGLGTLGYGGDVMKRGTNRLAYDAVEAAENPMTQMAKEFAERKGAAVSDPLPEKIDFANKRAATLGDSQAAELGANAGQNSFEIAMGDRLRKGLPEVDPGILQASTPEEMLTLAKNAESAINSAREVKLASLGNKVTIQPGDLTDSFQALNDRVVKLSKNSASEPIANSIKETAQKFLGDMRKLPNLSARDAIDMAQNLNEARRVLGQEFNAAKQAGQIRGDVASLGEMEASIEALGELGNGIVKAVDQKIGEPFFSGLNQKQSALKALSESGEKFRMGIAESRATRPVSRLVKTASEQGASPTSFGNDLVNSGPKTAVLKTLWNALKGNSEVSAPLQNALRAENMGPHAMKNIQDLRVLNANPAQLAPGPTAPLGGRLPQALMSMVTGGGALFGAANAQAMEPPPPLPRSSAIFENPQGLMQMVAMASQGNPQLMKDVQAVLSEPNSTKRDMAMMELTKAIPQIFEPSPYKSLWNGRIADPMEQKMYVDDIKSKHRSGQVDANYLAESISAINADGTVVPPPPPLPPEQKQPIATMGLERREYAY